MTMKKPLSLDSGKAGTAAIVFDAIGPSMGAKTMGEMQANAASAVSPSPNRWVRRHHSDLQPAVADAPLMGHWFSHTYILHQDRVFDNE